MKPISTHCEWEQKGTVINRVRSAGRIPFLATTILSIVGAHGLGMPRSEAFPRLREQGTEAPSPAPTASETTVFAEPTSSVTPSPTPIPYKADLSPNELQPEGARGLSVRSTSVLYDQMDNADMTLRRGSPPRTLNPLWINSTIKQPTISRSPSTPLLGTSILLN